MSESSSEHCCSVTLIVVGDDLDPDEITQLLDVTPDQCWRRGEHKKFVRPDGSVRVFDSIYDKSGWKRFTPAELEEDELATQLKFWIAFVQQNVCAFRKLKRTGVEIHLDLYVSTLESLDIHPAVLTLFGDCGISLEFTFSP